MALKRLALVASVLLTVWFSIAVPSSFGATLPALPFSTPGPHSCWQVNQVVEGQQQRVKICNITQGAERGARTCSTVTQTRHNVHRKTVTCRTEDQISAKGQCRYYWHSSAGHRQNLKQCVTQTLLKITTQICVTTKQPGKKPQVQCHTSREKSTTGRKCSYRQGTHGGKQQWTGRSCHAISVPVPALGPEPSPTPVLPTSTPVRTKVPPTRTPTPSGGTAVPTATSTRTPSPGATSTPGPMSGLHVVGNQIENGAGQVVRLLGVNRSGTQTMCIKNRGIFDGPSDATSVAAMVSWHINAVRVPLNEDCWLGINGVPAQYSGSAYQQAIEDYVSVLNSYGLAVILSLQRAAPGTQPALNPAPMPDRDHAPTFWTSVATTFANNSSVIFDLYNEPWPDNNTGSTAAWQCVLNGGTCPGVSYQAAGMQELVNVVRQAGASNVILVSGTQYTNDLTHWLQYVPTDSLNNLAASWHSYPNGGCATTACWNNDIARIATTYPVVAGEIGEYDCGVGYITPLMSWLDAHGIGYLAWTWDPWKCSSPALITDYSGTPTQYGAGFRDHLAVLAGS